MACIDAGFSSCPHEQRPAPTQPCSQDAVPRSGKFITLFKRGGHRVIMNTMGDLLVRPSPLEASLRQIPAGNAQPAA